MRTLTRPEYDNLVYLPIIPNRIYDVPSTSRKRRHHQMSDSEDEYDNNNDNDSDSNNHNRKHSRSKSSRSFSKEREVWYHGCNSRITPRPLRDPDGTVHRIQTPFYSMAYHERRESEGSPLEVEEEGYPGLRSPIYRGFGSPIYVPGSPTYVPASPIYVPGSPIYMLGSPVYMPTSTDNDGWPG